MHTKYIKKTDEEMKRPVTVGNLIIAFVVMVLGIVGALWQMSDRFRQEGVNYTNHEERIKRLEDERRDLKEAIEKVREQNTQILVLLQNKQDRK